MLKIKIDEIDFTGFEIVRDKYNRIDNDIYAPGTLSSNFNPERKTIIESIVENSKITANHLIKYIDK